MKYHSLSTDDSLKSFNVSLNNGLSASSVKLAIKKYGYNELQEAGKYNILAGFLGQFKDFMIIVLLVAAAVSYITSCIEGNPDPIDSIIILSIVVLNAVMGVFQEARAERTLDALKKIAPLNSTVIRDGKKISIPARLIVPGDIIILEAGQIIPADARLLESVNLQTDESSLTGESHPVNKNASIVLNEVTAVADQVNMVLSGTSIVKGRGCAIVTSTGMNTEVGHIARLINESIAEKTPLQLRLASTGRMLALGALFICIILFIVGLIQGRSPYIMFMVAVSLAVSSIPEGLPAIVTIMLSLGVSRMAKKNAVVRKLPAVETLGSATYICSDKTGTLTQNKMTVVKAADYSGEIKLESTSSVNLLSHAALCSDNGSDTTEQSIISAYEKYGISKTTLDQKYPRVYEIPFDSAKKSMTTIHKYNGKLRVITKGAFDILISHCSRILINNSAEPLSASVRNSLDALHNKMTSSSLRVLGCAYKDIDSLPKNNDSIEAGLIFIGFIGMMDPPRPEVKGSVEEAKKAGITPVMITGDYSVSAYAIAKEIGIAKSSSEVISGNDLDIMSSDKLNEEIKHYHVFARVSPSHKVRIVQTLKSGGEIVAMTGDGINDAPALKNADIGCAMGLMGTDVAKNAADIVLTDDNFATIVSAVKEGRGIYSNIQKAVHFLLSCNTGEIITIFIAILLGLPSPLLPIQLLWVNLITDSLPAIALGVEPVDKNIMKLPPIRSGKSIFTKSLASSIILQGILIGVISLTAFLAGGEIYGNTMAFAVLSLSQLFHSFNTRSQDSLFRIGFLSNKKLILSFFIGCILLIGVISVPWAAELFKLTPLDTIHWLQVLGLSFIPVPVCEIQKLLLNQSKK